MRRHRLIGDVMRWCGERIALEWRLSVTRPVQQQVAVADPLIELPVLVPAVRLLQQFDEPRSVGVGNLAGGEALHHAIDHGYEVAANGPVVVTESNPLGGCFQWCPPRVEFQRVVAEQAHRPDIAAGGHTGRNVIGEARFPKTGDLIHLRSHRGLQRRAAAQ